MHLNGRNDVFRSGCSELWSARRDWSLIVTGDKLLCFQISNVHEARLAFVLTGRRVMTGAAVTRVAGHLWVEGGVLHPRHFLGRFPEMEVESEPNLSK